MRALQHFASEQAHAAFMASLRRGFQIASFVEVWHPDGYVLADSDTFNVTGGSVTVDGSASIQRRIDQLMIVPGQDTELVPDEAEDLFSVVSSNELRVYTGMVIPELGLTQLLLQGIFGLEGCDVEDTGDGFAITLSAYDRGMQVSRARLTAAEKLAASNPPGTTAITTAIYLIQKGRPGTQVKLGAIDPGTQSPYDKGGHPEFYLDEGADPWEAARKLVADIGWEMFMDWDGQVLMRPVLDPNAALESVWSYMEGVDSTLVAVRRRFSNSEAYNGQFVTGENTSSGFPARGFATDDDPASPTRWGGRYGKVPEFYTSELIRTDAQATEVAKARLNQRKGANENLVFDIVPNHAHDYGDVVTITRARSKVDRTYIIESFQLGLTAASGGMTITTRQRKA